MATPRRSTMATNPFDEQLRAAQEPAAPSANGTTQPWRDRITVPLAAELQERIRNAVFWTPGLTLGAFALRAFTHALEEVECANGGPFPARHGELTAGRPIG